MSWDYVTLDKLGSISRGKSKHRPRNDRTLFGGKYPFIQTADVKAAGLYLNEYTETYNDKGLAQSKLWPAGTLCITIAANIADTTILGIDACFPDSVMGFVPYEGVSNVKFVKYAFDILQRDCKKISQGTAQDNLSWKKLSTIKFPAPDIEIQDKIVSILSVYDDLIENNQKQIKLLEEVAQRLYKEWFVDLRFPGYEDVEIVDGVPEGWYSGVLGDVAENSGNNEKRENREKYAYYLPIDCLPKKSLAYFESNDVSMAESSLISFKKNDIIFGAMRPYFHKVVIGRDNGLTRSTCFVINSKTPEYWSYLTMLLFSADTINYATRISIGTTMPYVRWKDFVQMPIIIPSEDIACKFGKQFTSISNRITVLAEQNTRLENARNRLLPKLMSGEIEV